MSPVFDTLDQAELQAHDTLTVNQALNYLPRVAIDHKSPGNQTGISIGGFDSRQVPLFLDGIPAYIPFDGYVDLTRYLTGDIAEIQVAKLYSSPLLGPNTLGGDSLIGLSEGTAGLGNPCGSFQSKPAPDKRAAIANANAAC